MAKSHFNTLCQAVERHYPALRSTMESAAVFEFPDAHPRVMGSYAELVNDFAMPFPITAIVTPRSAIVVTTLPDEGEFDQHREPGLRLDEKLVVLVCTTAKQWAEGCESTQQRIDMSDGSSVIMLGSVWREDAQNSFLCVPSIYDHVNGNRRFDLLRCIGQPNTEGLQCAARDIVDYGLQCAARDIVDYSVLAARRLHILNRPSNWIVRTSGTAGVVRKRNGRAPKKIPRTNQRPIHIVISDEERVRYFRRDTTDTPRGAPVPHARRAHWRTIGEDEEGRPVRTRVRATWVGPREAMVGGRRYEIMLDL